MDYRGIDIRVTCADVFAYTSDLLVLKHAQRAYGVDEKVITVAAVDRAKLPGIASDLLIECPYRLRYRHLLFLGVEPIGDFNYRSVRDFSRRALAKAMEIMPPVHEITSGSRRRSGPPGSFANEWI